MTRMRQCAYYPTIAASPPPHDYAGEYPIFSQEPPQITLLVIATITSNRHGKALMAIPAITQPPRRTTGGVRAGAIFLLTLLSRLSLASGCFPVGYMAEAAR